MPSPSPSEDVRRENAVFVVRAFIVLDLLIPLALRYFQQPAPHFLIGWLVIINWLLFPLFVAHHDIIIFELPYLAKNWISHLFSWLLSLCWAQRRQRYSSPLEQPQGKICRLCRKCSSIVDRSNILRGSRWRLTRVKEQYEFHDKDEFHRSSESCHLCSLLWHASFGAPSKQACLASSEGIRTSELQSTTPLLSGAGRSPNYTGSQTGGGGRMLSVEISATREFGQEQSIRARVCEEGSNPFLWLDIKDCNESQVSHQHNCQESTTTGSKASMSWAQELIARCEKDHDHCRNRFIPSENQQYLPKRLIDVRSKNKGVVQLLSSDDISDGEHVQYAALSHCWGDTVKCELRKDNEETLRTILIDRLDRNFREAVEITYNLGIDYLWIDSLCIMQCTEEWEQQSGDMGLVYARAKCVISATASKNSDGGCYRTQLPPYDCVLCSGPGSSLVVRSSTKYADLPQVFNQVVERSCLTTRGWTFQERFLAKRVLHMCSGLILFECNTFTTSEWHGEADYPRNTVFRHDGIDNVREVPPPGPEPHPKEFISTTPVTEQRSNTPDGGVKKRYPNPDHMAWKERERLYLAASPSNNTARLSMRGAFSFLWSFKGQAIHEQAEFHLRWYEMVTHYSVRSLTNDGDKLIAMAGVAYFIQQKTGRKYAAGLWYETLLFNLLWVVDDKVKRRPAGRSVPTWSWASIDGKISHRLKVTGPSPGSQSSSEAIHRSESVSRSLKHVEPLISDMEVQPIHTINGLIHDASLKLSCKLETFDPSLTNYSYDTVEKHLQDEIRCLPVIEFVSDKVQPPTKEPQVHGILIRSIPSVLNQGEDACRQYERVGYFWGKKTSIFPGIVGEREHCIQIV
ncbi:hypothetical protein LCI18_007832 [Fusarium solani-melongenae]|uniref:Uncharacterized protein n=1 Tax=Fusarium solani subsp. cucurbitae TaxID=2747967 RepID=A0ACD3Z6X5_FUSSC|nr:hypothetical protein LCI18_007832 [Fusarium solani-melongenae]